MEPTAVTHLLLESGSPGLADPAERLARQRHDRRLALRLLREPLVDFCRLLARTAVVC